MAEKIIIHEILEPIADWYGGGTEGNRSDLDIIIDVVSDLQKDRAELLTQAERITKLEADNKQLLELSENLDEHPEDYDGPCLCQLCKSYG